MHVHVHTQVHIRMHKRAAAHAHPRWPCVPVHLQVDISLDLLAWYRKARHGRLRDFGAPAAVQHPNRTYVLLHVTHVAPLSVPLASQPTS